MYLKRKEFNLIIENVNDLARKKEKKCLKTHQNNTRHAKNGTFFIVECRSQTQFLSYFQFDFVSHFLRAHTQRHTYTQTHVLFLKYLTYLKQKRKKQRKPIDKKIEKSKILITKKEE